MLCDCYIVRYGESRCLGAKEIDACNCEGDTTKCTFYPEKRKVATKPTMTREKAEALLGVKIID